MRAKYAVTFAAACLFALAPAGLAQSRPMGGSPSQGSPGQNGQSGQTNPDDRMGRMGQMGQTDQTGQTVKKEPPDQKFAADAAKGNQAEIQIGQLAQQKADSPAAKTFGQHLVNDHTAAENQLQQIATKKGLTLDTQPSRAQKSEYDKLNKLSGAAFDKELARYEAKDHKKDISEFEKEANKGSDSDIKGYAQSQISGLQMHLKMAEDLLKGNASSAMNEMPSNH